jgi:acetyltransferase-like isoleucine patch superfamily enzyme
VRRLAAVLAAVCPQPVKRAIYRALGHRVAPDARIGLSLIDVDRMVLGPGAVIGHLNVVKELRSFEVGRGAYVRHLNTISGARYEGWPATVRIGEEAQVMNRHFIDAGGEVVIGARTILAGRDTQVWTHDRRPTAEGVHLTWQRVEVGEDCYVGARSTLLPSASLASGSTLGAASVLTGGAKGGPGAVLAGNPARVVAGDG